MPKLERGAWPTKQEWLDRWTYPTEEAAMAAIEHHKADEK
jgi:hypothetical protein